MEQKLETLNKYITDEKFASSVFTLETKKDFQQSLSNLVQVIKEEIKNLPNAQSSQKKLDHLESLIDETETLIQNILKNLANNRNPYGTTLQKTEEGFKAFQSEVNEKIQSYQKTVTQLSLGEKITIATAKLVGAILGAVVGFCAGFFSGLPILTAPGTALGGAFGMLAGGKVGEKIVEQFDPVKKATKTFTDSVRSVTQTKSTFFAQPDESKTLVSPKIYIIGPKKSGKTAVRMGLAEKPDDEFSNQYEPTIGIDWEYINTSSGKKTIWEVGGGIERKELFKEQPQGSEKVLITLDSLEVTNHLNETNKTLQTYVNWATEVGIPLTSIQVVLTQTDKLSSFGHDRVEDSNLAKLLKDTGIDTKNVVQVSAKNNNFSELKTVLGISDEPQESIRHGL